MHTEMHELFLLAARYFYKNYKRQGGSQGELAKKLGITNSYLSSVMSGTRKASLELQDQIANTLFGPYDKFLALGRRIKDGHEPLEEKKASSADPVESLLAQLTHYVIDHGLFVGIGHHDHVVLGAAEGLYALAVRGAGFRDLFRDGR